MGYYKNSQNIDCFEPDNDEITFYIRSCFGYTLSEILDKCKEYFGEEASLDNIEITSEKIHTDCIYYDLYDSSDYTDYIVCTFIKDQQ